MDISSTMDDTGLKFSMCALMILPEGSASQIFYLGLTFHFMSKNGKLFAYFCNINFYISLNKN